MFHANGKYIFLKQESVDFTNKKKKRKGGGGEAEK